jgi:hypothetical protein
MLLRFLSFLFATSVVAEAVFAAEGEMNREFRWRGDSATAQVRAMSFTRTSDRYFAQRTLLEFPPETRLVITSTLNPVTGEAADELASEATGWRLRWSRTYSVGADNLKEYFSLSSDAEESFDGTQRAVHRVSTSAGFAFDTLVVLTSDTEGMMDDLYSKISEGKSQAILADQIPREITAALRFVYCDQERLDSGVPYFRHVAHFVFRLLGEPVGEGACRDFSAEPLPERLLPRLPAMSPEALEFISRFKTVENSDPFQDRRP